MPALLSPAGWTTRGNFQVRGNGWCSTLTVEHWMGSRQGSWRAIRQFDFSLDFHEACTVEDCHSTCECSDISIPYNPCKASWSSTYMQAQESWTCNNELTLISVSSSWLTLVVDAGVVCLSKVSKSLTSWVQPEQPIACSSHHFS